VKLKFDTKTDADPFVELAALESKREEARARLVELDGEISSLDLLARDGLQRWQVLHSARPALQAIIVELDDQLAALKPRLDAKAIEASNARATAICAAIDPLLTVYVERLSETVTLARKINHLVGELQDLRPWPNSTAALKHANSAIGLGRLEGLLFSIEHTIRDVDPGLWPTDVPSEIERQQRLVEGKGAEPSPERLRQLEERHRAEDREREARRQGAKKKLSPEALAELERAKDLVFVGG